jgi:cell shape-determining protein MreC
MKQRNIIALSIFTLLVLSFAFLQTPLMTKARQRAWTTWVSITAKLFNLDPIDANQTVIEQLQQLQTANISLRAQLQDYHRLRQQLGTPTLPSLRTIEAAVIGRPLDTFQSQFVINRGLADGVVLKAPVITGGTVLVGFVSEAHSRTAVIQSLLHPSTSITVETVPSDQDTPVARGLLQSRSYTSLAVTTVPQDIPLLVGQPVVTVAKDTTIPFGLIVGTVTAISSEEHEAYQEALLAYPYDLDQVDAVQVIVAP